MMSEAYRQRRNAKAAERFRRLRIERPELHRARNAVRTATRNGTLKRQPCERCGTTVNVHAHHDDHQKLLEVMWLCPTHHRQRHDEIGRNMSYSLAIVCRLTIEQLAEIKRLRSVEGWTLDRIAKQFGIGSTTTLKTFFKERGIKKAIALKGADALAAFENNGNCYTRAAKKLGVPEWTMRRCVLRHIKQMEAPL